MRLLIIELTCYMEILLFGELPPLKYESGPPPIFQQPHEQSERYETQANNECHDDECDSQDGCNGSATQRYRKPSPSSTGGLLK